MMAFIIKSGYMIHIPGGKVFKRIEDLWIYVDRKITEYKRMNKPVKPVPTPHNPKKEINAAK